MKLRPVLALLLGIALACGGEGEEDVVVDVPPPVVPEPTTPPLPPVDPPAPPVTPAPVTPAAEGGVVVAPATPDPAKAESKVETKKVTKTETKKLSTTVRVQKGDRHEMRPRAEQQLEREARRLGYSGQVSNIQLSDVDCRGSQCTASATGTASREVVVEEAVVVASEVCPARFKERAVAAGAQYSCLCPADKITGSVWGNGIYTADSSVCRAAVHAGALPASGGAVTVQAAAGCSTYSAGKQNGIDSGSWGSYSQSFFFPGHGSGSCG